MVNLVHPYQNGGNTPEGWKTANLEYFDVIVLMDYSAFTKTAFLQFSHKQPLDNRA